MSGLALIGVQFTPSSAVPRFEEGYCARTMTFYSMNSMNKKCTVTMAEEQFAPERHSITHTVYTVL